MKPEEKAKSLLTNALYFCGNKVFAFEGQNDEVTKCQK